LDLPYAGDSEEAYISAVATKEPLPARQRDRTLPRDLETVLMKCLERDPDRRYVSAAELRDDLQRFLTDQPVKARRAGIVLKMARLGKRHRWPVAAGTLAAILIAVSLPIMLRKWDEARDRARLRSTLEQVIATGSPPERIQSDWNVLAVSLRQQIEQDPHGPLANLARSAATRVVAHIGTPNNLNLLNDASFTPPWALVGLVSRPPPVNLKVTMFEIGVPLHILVQVEAAVGAGQWTSIGWVRTVRKPGSSADSAICRFSLPRQALSVGSNRVELRAIVTFHDLLETERAGRYELSYQCSQPGRLELPGDLAKRPAVTQFTRMLKPMSIRLFERYPDDLPQEVDPNTTVGDIDRWFKPERFRLVQVRVPDRGAGSALVGSVVYPWNSARKICAPQELAAPAGFATGLEMSGVFTVTPPVPIAATVDWRPSDSATAMLSFPLILGQGTFRFDATPGPGSALPAAPLLFTPNGVFSPLKVGGGVEPVPVPIESSPIYYTSVFQRDKDIIMSKMMAKDPMGGPPSYATSVGPSDQFTMGVIRFRDPVWLSALLPETSTPGVLHLRPARDLALMNYFERYLGDLTRPVSLEVLTLTFQGQGWVNDPGCTSPTQKK
jgi:hypothetical protein